jgi:hypothetical protein
MNGHSCIRTQAPKMAGNVECDTVRCFGKALRLSHPNELGKDRLLATLNHANAANPSSL